MPEQVTAIGDVANVSVRDLTKVARRSFFRLGRIQAALLVLGNIAFSTLPTFVHIPWTDVKASGLLTPYFISSLLVSSLASVVSLVVIRNLRQYPGVHRASYIVPSVLAVFGLAIVLMFFFRMEYSRYVLLASFFATNFILYTIHLAVYGDRPVRLALIPDGNFHGVKELRSVEWVELEIPNISFDKVEGVVADLSADLSPIYERLIGKCILAGISVYDIRNIRESLTGRVELRHLSENSFGALLPSMLYLRAKRVADIILALVLLPVFVPVILAAAAIVKLESNGPAFFVQPRVGFRLSIFRIYKIRTMRSLPGDADTKFTRASDNRITPVGHFLRKYRIDEMPQILNILKGEMSWIGPRPEAVELASWYEREIPYYVYRHAVRPGLSGWAQVNQGNVAEIEAATEKLHYDFYYTKFISPWLDFLILVRTIATIFTGFGSR